MTAGTARRDLWVRLGLVAAIGVAGFGITAAGRSSEPDGAAAPATTSAPAPAATLTDPSPTPERLVVEVPMPILAPLRLTGLPDDVGAFNGADVQTEVTELLSPVVGVALVPSGGGSDAASWSPAPPEFAPSLGLAVTAPDPDGNEEAAAGPDLDDKVEPIEIPDGALDAVIRTAAEDQRRRVDPEVDPEVDPDAGPDAGTGAPPQLGDPIVLVDGDVGFVDPCAEADDDRCPDPGEPATVVRLFGQQIPPPLSIVVTANPTGECGADVADDELRVAVESTTPVAELRLGYWRAVRSLTSPNVDVATPDETREAWMTAFEAAAVDGPPPPPIVHCLTLTGIGTRDAAGYRYRIDARDVFDQVWLSERQAWSSPFFTTELQTPPTVVWPLTDNEVLVSAAHRADQSVGVLAFRRTGDAGADDPCQSTDARVPGYDTAVTIAERTLSTKDATELLAAGQDPDYLYRTAGTMRLAEGSAYRLCVYWSVTEPSFSAGVERTMGYDLITPDALDTSFTVVDFDIDGTDRAGLDPGDLDVAIRPASRALMVGHEDCGSWRNRVPIETSVSVDELICDVDPRATALYARGAVVEITTLDIDGALRASHHVIRTRSCTGLCVPPESQFFRVELPSGAPERDFWCGGFGDACDRPSERSYGTVLIRVDYANSIGDFNAGWSVSDPVDLGDARPGPPETPQLDTSIRPTVDGPTRSHTVTVPILADRQVTVEASLLTSGAPSPCVNEGGNTTASSDVLVRSHTLTFDGLCPNQGLFVVVTLTDRAGNSSVWHAEPGAPGFPADAERWFRGFVIVPRVEWAFTASIEFALPTPMYRVQGLGVSFDGSDTTGGTWYPVDVRPGLPGCTGAAGPVTTRLLPPDGTSRRRAFPEAEVSFTIVVDVELLELTCRQPTDTFEQPGPHVFRLDLPLDEVVVGESYVLAGSIPVAGLPDPAATIDVTGTITIVSER